MVYISQISPHVPWQVPFYLFGSLGFIWCAVWMHHSQLLLGSPSSLPQPLLCKQVMALTTADNKIKITTKHKITLWSGIIEKLLFISIAANNSLYCYVQTTNPMRLWRKFFTQKPLLAVYLAHFSMNWTAYIVMHWLPTYLSHEFKAKATDLSFAAAPYVLNSLMSIG